MSSAPRSSLPSTIICAWKPSIRRLRRITRASKSVGARSQSPSFQPVPRATAYRTRKGPTGGRGRIGGTAFLSAGIGPADSSTISRSTCRMEWVIVQDRPASFAWKLRCRGASRSSQGDDRTFCDGNDSRAVLRSERRRGRDHQPVLSRWRYVLGSVEGYRDLLARIALTCGDCHAAYRWALANGVEPRRLLLAGDSAGGSLAVATLVALLRAQ
jgi:hypothetical protein